MAPRIDDRWVWLGFGVFLFFAVRQLRNSIQETVLLTEIDPAQYEDREERDKKSPEDCIYSPLQPTFPQTHLQLTLPSKQSPSRH